MPEVIDITGKKYDLLTVIKQSDKRNPSGRILWECQCECGNICLKTKFNLERHSKKPKACSPQCQVGIKVGDKFNRLTVIEIIPHPKQATEYKCQCDCGNIIYLTSYPLREGKIKSCGCYRQDLMHEIGLRNSQSVDISNQRFGKLIALEPTEKRQNKSVIWKCICDCGKIHFASIKNLKNGDVTRCPDCHILSKGEEQITQLLKELNLPFIKEKTFDTCVSPDTNYLLRFDFWVDNKYIIEYDGKQHFEETNFFSSKLKEIQKRDDVKNKWCKENNIPLIRIPYTYLSRIRKEDLILESSKFIIKYN